MNEESALIQPQSYFLSPSAKLNTILAAYQAKKEFIDNVLKEGLDYGTIPGGTKNTLLKPGAEKMAQFFSIFETFDDVTVIEDWMGEQHGGEPFFYYRQKCNGWKFYNGEMIKIASADGSCNSWEKKYRYRQQERTCPNCKRQTIIKGKEEYGGGWVCFTKKGGCGSKYKDDDPAITGQEVGQIKSPDVAEQTNTILKMAQKRAYVAMILIATGASDYFTQDIEDYIDVQFSEMPDTPSEPIIEEPKPKPEKKSTPAKPSGNGNNIVSKIVEAGIAENTFEASKILNKLDLKKFQTPEEQLQAVRNYRGFRDMGFTPEQAAKMVNAGEVPH